MNHAPDEPDDDDDGGNGVPEPEDAEEAEDTDGEEPVFSGYSLTFFSELTALELEDDLPEGTVIEVMRELSKRLAELADYYEQVGTSELFE